MKNASIQNGVLPKHDLSHVEAFLFDLDDVLYPHGAFLSYDMFWETLNAYAAEQNGLSVEEATAITDRMRADGGHKDILKEWAVYGAFDFKGFTNRLDAVELANRMQPCGHTLRLLQGLKGRRIVFTNSHTTHAQRILAHLQLAEVFDHVSDYLTRGERLKPEPAVYHDLVKELSVDPSRCVMVEDTVANLAPAHAMGMTTVLIHPQPKPEARSAAYVDRWHTSLTDWLESVEQ
ncbi:MAG: HAD-IA family hydrolase [Proteobacteria bacterium]|nr:HAD-IA family hydrolase [Pseudomonadota bacterium]